MARLVLDFAELCRLTRLDPFSVEDKPAATPLYLALRGKPEQSSVAERDEAGVLLANLWID